MINKFLSLFIKNPNDYENQETRNAYGIFSSVLGVIFNVLLFAIKLFAGIISGVTSIVADALNNLTDASSNVIGFLGFKLSAKPADAGHPYGHGRYEYLSAALVAVLVMLIGLELLKTGVEKIITPNVSDFSIITVVILIISIVIKILMGLINKSIGVKISSETLIATAADSRNDAIATFAVLLSLFASRCFNVTLDGYVTVAVAAFILINGFSLIKNTIDPLLGKPASKSQVESIKRKLLSYDKVLGIHDLIVHDYGPGRQFASVHVEMSAAENVLISHEIIDGIEKDFLKNDNLVMVIHYDPVCVDNAFVTEIRNWLSTNLKDINDKLTVHDVRVVEGVERSIVIFDCVVPYDVGYDEKTLINVIDEKIKSTYPKLDSVITIDRSYVGEN